MCVRDTVSDRDLDSSWARRVRLGVTGALSTRRGSPAESPPLAESAAGPAPGPAGRATGPFEFATLPLAARPACRGRSLLITQEPTKFQGLPTAATQSALP